MRRTPREFGKTFSGQAAELCRLTTANGLEADVTDYGATLVSLRYPDQNGKVRDLVLGYDSVLGYETGSCYFGATVGRNANRIRGAVFDLNGQEYHLSANEGRNNLHSGPNGYSFRLWQIREAEQKENAITFHLSSPDGDQGFPGNLEASVTYELTGDGALKIHYEAVSDQSTLINMTNHGYFNLNGHDSGNVLNQWMELEAEYYTPVCASSALPTGEIREVAGTPFDFRRPKKIGQEIEDGDVQIDRAGGYDHNFVIDGVSGALRKAASAFSEESGIAMEVWTDLPCVQFYTANFVEGQKGKEGAVYGKRSGFCLETQYFPNSINTPGFPVFVLQPGSAGKPLRFTGFIIWHNAPAPGCAAEGFSIKTRLSAAEKNRERSAACGGRQASSHKN